MKYGPWYWFPPYLLCQDRSAAARRSACSVLFYAKHRFTCNNYFSLSQHTGMHHRQLNVLKPQTLPTTSFSAIPQYPQIFSQTATMNVPPLPTLSTCYPSISYILTIKHNFIPSTSQQTSSSCYAPSQNRGVGSSGQGFAEGDEEWQRQPRGRCFPFIYKLLFCFGTIGVPFDWISWP